MATQYFFTHDDTQFGPYSALELLGLATAGKIVPTDAVWREGIGVPIPAARVGNLFPSPAAPAEADVAPALTDAAASAFVPPPEKKAPTRVTENERPRRVMWIKGGVLVSQDGKYVQYRKKCPTCNTEDQSRSTQLIRPGSMKIPYYCRKCRKGRQVEMLGQS